MISEKRKNNDKNAFIEGGEQPAGNTVTPRQPATFVGARWYDAVIVLLFAIVAQLCGGVITIVLSEALLWESINAAIDISETQEYIDFMQARYIALTLIFSIIIGFSAVAFYARLRGWRKPLSFKAPGWASPFRLLCGYLLLWSVSIAVEPLAELLPGSQDMLGGGGWLLFAAVLLAPLFEEVFFRGYIAGALRSAYGGVAAWLLSSLLFGLMHVEPSIVVTATFGGLVLGYYYLRYRSLVMVIMLHAMNNITACFLKAIDLDGVPMREVLGGGTAYWLVYGICAAITLLALWRMMVGVSRLKSDNYQTKK
jgi:membrane protease YdiL (CAAX protease family)